MEGLREVIDSLAAENDAAVLWNQPLNEARLG